MTQVQLKNLSKVFSGAPAVDAIDLDVVSGEFLVLLGPSGCGKTTTLRMVCGLEQPTSGSIWFNEADVTQVCVQNRRVGLVSQRFGLFPHMTVEQNVAFGLSVRGLPAELQKKQVNEMLDIVHLSEFANRFPSQLSGGQCQRVAIARTLVTKPDVLLLDEPMASLDTLLRAQMRQFIRDLHDEYGMTTLLVTHDQVEAMDLADRIAVIFDGRIAQLATPEEIYQNPVNERTARFMGHSNIFECTPSSDGHIESPFGRLTLGTPARPRANQPTKAMLRFESIQIDSHKSDTQHNVLKGTIKRAEFLGAMMRYTLQVAQGTLTVEEASTNIRKTGEVVSISLPPEQIWLLDASA
ncbi:Spermidine/putrescine import ATP-binding protein PotA [Pseudovibrio axinellae]|uniref:Spermidine/putrescine import ATP-binding protein PotA n=1 Tax=Pseudovibrio axinellae TaxID=989403 RepID=A0A165VTQ9_9HYPH|nr:ABC transporter ATP-binding protein [Pseudovibrio axinellae]KZL15430.1 Spermidine/putrescine import ATP-binding protein PotA [Pseudovibrio axinellae]SER56130.1 putative spermidine/putrescine transport system ATP-binding protein [Pseudovibrio axinellae]